MAAGSLTDRDGQAFGLRGRVRTDTILSIEQLTLTNGYTPTLSVTGTVPVQVLPSRGEGMVVWNEAQSIALAGDWMDSQSEALSVPLGSWGQLGVSRPELRFRISGTTKAPTAEFTAMASKLVLPANTNHVPWPKVEDLQLALEVRPERLRLKNFAAKVG